MENVPNYISIVFGSTTILTFFLFYKATNYSKTTLIILLLWLAFQSVLGISEFYKVTSSIPPRFVLLVLPPLVCIIILFATEKGRKYIDTLDQKMLTLLHIVRIPVELVLFWLFLYKTIPQEMTFEGKNFDILSGLTAPFIVYFGYHKQMLNRKVLLLWNFICLGLLINIVTYAILSAPFPFQQMAFDQPNIAVLYFPFIWLPAFIVPLVLFSHLSAFRQLLYNKNRP